MSKRKSQAIHAGMSLKKLRLNAVEGIPDIPDDITHQTPLSSCFSHGATGDIGLIESITLKNFMCHHLLGPCQFGPNVNFIVGANGSGKTAILTALIVGLGGIATVTNRAMSLKDFVKIGESTADITVNLRNRGPDAYKSDIYGDCISVEHRILSDGSRTYKLKSKSGHSISNKKEELMAILDHFNIQLDNPVSILSQEMSKQFLHSKSESDKYKFFMKATLLDQMKRDYIHIKQTKLITAQQVERQEESLKKLKQQFLKKKERYENMSSLGEMKLELENLKKTMAWCLVREKAQFIQQAKENLEKEEKNSKYQDNLQLCKRKVTDVENRLEGLKRRVDSVREEQASRLGDSLKLKQQIKINRKAHREQELVYFRALNKLKQSEQEQKILLEKKAKVSGSTIRGEETKYKKQQEKISRLKGQLAELEKTRTQLNEEIENKQQAVLKGKEEQEKLRLEERNIHMSYTSKLKRKHQLLASRSNKLRRFGDYVPDLLTSIAEAFDKGLFIKKPIGPIGVCIGLKDPSLAVAVESCLRSFIKAFCCDNYKDEKTLQELMSRFCPEDRRPLIIVSSFSDKVYDTGERKAYHPDYPSVLEVITASEPVILNCLIDMRGIESILFIKDKHKARKVIQLEQPPLNCREAFTIEGDQVYPNRYYTSDVSMAKYLSGDLETEIRMLESELENHQALLSRFQLHRASVSEDIQSIERKLNSTIMTQKKILMSVNHTKAKITELENANEEQMDDISSMEEVAQEIRLKIEAEKQIVSEAALELDNRQRIVEDVVSRYQTAREQIDQLSEDMELLKDEQLKLEAEFTKHKQNFKIFETKLRVHEKNIQSLRSDLARREKELQGCVAKAKEIGLEPQEVTRSASAVDTEITQLQTKIKVYESSYGKLGQVVREYAEALKLYRKKTNQVRDLRRFVNQLNDIILDRQNRYKVLRMSLSVRCKLYFTNFLAKMNCYGSMAFDHNNETLTIAVKPPGRDDDGVSDAKSLSGGERSFSTICFMLSLWEITESPFRCLDEFDVFMDMHNRRRSLDLLLELSERQHLRQFIFITPLDTSNVPRTSLITMHQLQDPERVQSEPEEEDLTAFQSCSKSSV
ncbi:structural maintenance of chromosomes protein 6 [Antennarius striatus]|uniref:structural maintenance of chromosomes protein 6 n=1 Tax=Antennarius striatus TaxID=241820 RepID=UPI0035B4025F